MITDKKTQMVTNIRDTLLKNYEAVRKKINLPDILRKEKRKILSLDIGKRTLKIAFLSLSKEKVELLKYDIKGLNPKESQDETKALKEFINNFRTINSIIKKDIIINLQDSDALIIERIDLPSLPEKEIKEAIKWEVKDNIPFDLSQAQIDWQIIGEYTDKDGAKRKDIILACIKKEVIDRYIRIVRDLGLNVIDIKSPPFGYSYILEKIEVSKKGTASVLDIGATSSEFLIYKDGKLSFLRNLPFSSEQLITSMSGTLISDKGRIELTEEKADKIRKEFGIPQDPNEILKEDIKASQVISLIRPSLERLVSEIKKSIDYYVARFESEAPKFLYITGGGSNLKGLDVYLINELKFDVQRLPLSEVINIPQDVDKDRFKEDMNQLAGAVGAGLGINEKPSLLSQEYKVEKVEALEKISLRLIGITVGFIFLFSFFAVRVRVSDYKNRLKNARLHLQMIDEIDRLNKRKVQKQVLVERIKADKIAPDWILKELSNLVPTPVLLKDLELDQEKNVLILNGYVISREEKIQNKLTAFMKTLEASPLFGEATLSSSDKSMYEGREASRFEIRCDLVR